MRTITVVMVMIPCNYDDDDDRSYECRSKDKNNIVLFFLFPLCVISFSSFLLCHFHFLLSYFFPNILPFRSSLHFSSALSPLIFLFIFSLVLAFSMSPFIFLFTASIFRIFLLFCLRYFPLQQLFLYAFSLISSSLSIPFFLRGVVYAPSLTLALHKHTSSLRVGFCSQIMRMRQGGKAGNVHEGRESAWSYKSVVRMERLGENV